MKSFSCNLWGSRVSPDPWVVEKGASAYWYRDLGKLPFLLFFFLSKHERDLENVEI